jgi:chromosome segregation ATPase
MSDVISLKLPDDCPIGCPLIDRVALLEREIDRGDHPGSSVVNAKMNDFKTEIDIIKHDITIFNKYFEKIDTTINKLCEITEQLNRLVTLHDDRLELYREDFNNRKNENSDSIKLLEEKLDKLYEKNNFLEKKVIDNNIKNKEELKIEINDLKILTDKKFKKMEMWRYLIIGGAIVAGFFINQLVSSSVQRMINPSSHTVVIDSSPHK